MKTLKTNKKIPVQEWMKCSETKAVMEALAPDTLFVGGCVRNALLGEPVEDIDLATKYLPDEVIKRLEAADMKAIPTGIDHGTVTAVVGEKLFEVTTLRKDVETDGRHAVVAYSDDWAEDASRRDFTMNTLLADMEGNIYDPLGEGIQDCEARRVRFVGEPAHRIAEDYLRILRFFRFYALYGDEHGGEIDKDALRACQAAADKISTLSKERITQEFFKILSVDKPVDILNLMVENKVLSDLISPSPETLSSLRSLSLSSSPRRGEDSEALAELGEGESDLEFLASLCHFQKSYGLGFLASRLLILIGLDLEKVSVLENYLLIPKVFKKDMVAIAAVLALSDLKEEHAVKVAIYKHGRVPTAQALMIELAQDRVMNNFAPKALDLIQNWDIPEFPVSGGDLIAQGFKPGPELGKELARLEEEWIETL